MRLRLYQREIIIFLTGLVIGGALFSVSYGRLGLPAVQWGGNDFIEYWTLTKNFVDGHGFSLRNAEPFTPSALRTPGYPLFLSLSYVLTGGTVLASILQIVLFAFFGVLSFWILRELGMGERLAMIVGTLVLFEPDSASMGIYLISDTLANVLLFLSLFLFIRSCKERCSNLLFWSSLVLGISALVRPIILAVWVIYGILWMFNGEGPVFAKKKMAAIFISLALAIIPIAPWIARNYIVFGVPRVSSADTYNLYTVIVPQAVSLREGISYSEARDNLLNEFLSNKELQPLPEIRNIGYNFNRAEILMLEDFRYQPWMRRKFGEAMVGNVRYYLEAVFRGTVEYFTQVNWLTPLEHWDLVHPAYRPKMSFVDAFNSGGVAGFLIEVKRRFSCGFNCVISFGLQAMGRAVWALISVLALAGIAIWYRKMPNVKMLTIAISFFILLVAALHISFVGMQVQPRYRILAAPFLMSFALIGMRQLVLFLRGYIVCGREGVGVGGIRGL